MDFWKDLLLHSQGKLSFADSVNLILQIDPKCPYADFLAVEDRHSRKKAKQILDAKFEQLNGNKEQNDFKSFGVSKHQGKINLEILPADLREAHGKLSPIIRKISMLRGKLFACISDADRYAVAKSIIALVDDRRKIFTQIDQYIATGEDVYKPMEKTTMRQKAVLPVNYEVEHELRLLRSNRSKWKNNPRRIHDYNEVCAKIKELESKRHEI